MLTTRNGTGNLCPKCSLKDGFYRLKICPVDNMVMPAFKTENQLVIKENGRCPECFLLYKGRT